MYSNTRLRPPRIPLRLPKVPHPRAIGPCCSLVVQQRKFSTLALYAILQWVCTCSATRQRPVLGSELPCSVVSSPIPHHFFPRSKQIIGSCVQFCEQLCHTLVPSLLSGRFQRGRITHKILKCAIEHILFYMQVYLFHIPRDLAIIFNFEFI